MITTLDVCRILNKRPIYIYQLLQDAKVAGIEVKRIGRRIVWTKELLTFVETEAMRRNWITERKLSKLLKEETVLK